MPPISTPQRMMVPLQPGAGRTPLWPASQAWGLLVDRLRVREGRPGTERSAHLARETGSRVRPRIRGLLERMRGRIERAAGAWAGCHAWRWPTGVRF